MSMLHEFNYSGKAMGTDYSIAIVCEKEELADLLGHQAESEIRSYEERFSRFLPQSELSVLNKNKEAVVSGIFLAVLKASHKLFIQTKGIFNPLVQVERIGYTTNFDNLTTSEKYALNEDYDIDFSETKIEDTTGRVVLSPGQKLDFGGFLKGYLAEKLAKEIMGDGSEIKGVIVNLGGDIHTEGHDENGEPFAFTIYNPVTMADDISVTLHNESLATSGTYKRTWDTASGKKHHILDVTGTGNPETDVISASVIHPSGGKTEAFTKVFLSAPPDEALKLINESALRYVVITKSGKIITNTQ
jgi:FAD:protein FMN transferase